MAYDIDKVAKIIADLQNEGLAEAEIRNRLAQAGLPTDILDKALHKLVKTKEPEVVAKPSADTIVPAPSEIVSKKIAVPAAPAPVGGLIAKAPEKPPSIRAHMETQEEETSMDAMKAMVSAPSKAAIAKPSETAFLTPSQVSRPSIVSGGSTDDRLARIEAAVKDTKAHVAALQQITEQVLDTNRNILVGLKKK